MNFFSKNRLVFWFLIFLVVINLSVLITFLVFYMRNSASADQKTGERPEMVFCKELSLSDSQSEKVGVILADYRNSTDPISADIRDYRIQLLEELAKTNPDTVQLNNFTGEISLLQRQMQKASVKQYMALKEICNPEQCKRLSTLYFELYGCKGRCPGMGEGKGRGMMHQYRHGRGQQGCGNRMGNDSCSKN